MPKSDLWCLPKLRVRRDKEESAKEMEKKQPKEKLGGCGVLEAKEKCFMKAWLCQIPFKSQVG